jgi:hypothetical protein
MARSPSLYLREWMGAWNPRWRAQLAGLFTHGDLDNEKSQSNHGGYKQD